MANFKEETLAVLERNGKSWDDVRFICDQDRSVKDLNQFLDDMDFDYDNGYGGAFIQGLYIVGDDWWLERGEYDGSEWWEFKTIPVKPKEEDVRLADTGYEYELVPAEQIKVQEDPIEEELPKLWHDASERPDPDSAMQIIIMGENGGYAEQVFPMRCIDQIEKGLVHKWCYTTDLLLHASENEKNIEKLDKALKLIDYAVEDLPADDPTRTYVEDQKGKIKG